MRTLKSILLIVLVFLLTAFGCIKMRGVDTDTVEQQPAASTEQTATDTATEVFGTTSTSSELTLASGTPVTASSTDITSTSSSSTVAVPPVVEEPERFISNEYGVMVEYPKTWKLLSGAAPELPGGGSGQLAGRLEPLVTASSSAGARSTTTAATASSSTTSTTTVVGQPTEYMFPTVLTHVVVPQSNYVGTNLVAAYGTLSVADASSETVCSSFGYGQSPPIQTQANGNRYYYSLRMSTASGTIETARTLRTYQNRRCYEFDMAVYTASPSTVRSVDSESIFTLLANIAISLRYR